MERIFKERSQSLYNDFSDLFNEVESIETSTPPVSSDNNNYGDDKIPNSSNDSNNNNSNNGAPPKAEKEFNDYQAAKSYYESLADGPEKNEAYNQMNIKYQIFMNALKK